MTFRQNFAQDLKEAQLQGEALKVSVLRLLLASLNNREIEKRTKLSRSLPLEKLGEQSQLTEEEVIEVLVSEAKKRQEAQVAFRQGNRPELAEKEGKELSILEKYLPPEIPESDLRKIIQEAIKSSSAQGAQDVGKVMKELRSRLKKLGRVDGQLVRRLVQEMLS
ncbi:MAG: GatB/YqeY domain-containing protein [Candidatus Nealsonbacteria bacterium]|nr:GatB/YqeY domain-containing protein [Candidatus Nealsonbacteria bacterium]